MKQSRNHRYFPKGEEIGIRYKGGNSYGSSTSEPWSGQQAYLSDVFNRAATASQTPLQYYQGEQTAEFTPEQQAAMTATTNRANAGSDLLRTAQSQTLKEASGANVNADSNPYIGSYINKAFESSLPQFDTSAQSAGRYGGGAWGLGKGKMMADTTSGILGQQYATDRGIQQNAIAASPGMAEADYNDISKLAAVGEEKQGMNQQLINDQKSKWDFNQMEPWQRLGMYSNLVNGSFGGVTSSTSRSGK
jgi:hypothetical protein